MSASNKTDSKKNILLELSMILPSYPNSIFDALFKGYLYEKSISIAEWIASNDVIFSSESIKIASSASSPLWKLIENDNALSGSLYSLSIINKYSKSKFGLSLSSCSIEISGSTLGSVNVCVVVDFLEWWSAFNWELIVRKSLI